ncbi:MAG: Hsp20/alpha crystallin family protein [Patescibacteria group bacterium]
MIPIKTLDQTNLNTLVASPEGQLSIDVFETEDAIIIQSAIAGVAAKDLEISVDPDMITIRGARRRDRRMSSGTVHIEECFWGAFSRSVVLPVAVDGQKAEASLENGILYTFAVVEFLSA